MAATPSGLGYWLAGSDGGVFTFGPGGQFNGSLPSERIKPNKPVVSTVSRPPLATKVDPYAPSSTESSQQYFDARVVRELQPRQRGDRGRTLAGERHRHEP